MDSTSPTPQDLSGATIGATPNQWKRDSESGAEKTIQPGSPSVSPQRSVSSSNRSAAEDSNRSGSGRPISRRARAKKRPHREHRQVPLDETDDRYVDLGELGRGGWGIVGRVYDRQLQREVAVKRIRSNANITALEQEQFLHEARVTSGLQHPGVVPVHELECDPDGDTYYVMKLLEGDTLRHHIRLAHQTKPSQGWNRHDLVIAITPLLLRFVDVCNAISYAHENGIIHRDLKPTNVMAGAFGETIVVDWGLARDANPSSARDLPADETNCGIVMPERGSQQNPEELSHEAYRSSRSRSTAPRESEGSVVGTPSYMAPEQARGELSEMGIHSDLYALGGILYEIVAGKNAHAGIDVQTVLRRAQEGVTTPLSENQPAVPSALAEIINTAMAFDPGDRYDTAKQLADDVQRFVTGERVSVYQETVLEKGIRWCRRHRGTALTIATATVILLIGSVFSSIVIRSAHRAEKKSRVKAELAHQRSLNRLIEARDAADTWLVELSGATQFHPAMAPIRKELLERATQQYQTLLDEPIEPLPSSTAKTVPGSSLTRDHMTRSAEWLERAKCHLRLGDLYRLSFASDGQSNDRSKLHSELAAKHYRSANRILIQLDSPAPSIQQVSLRPNILHSNTNVDALHDWKTQEPDLSQSIQLETINVRVGEILNQSFHDVPESWIKTRERLDRWLPWESPVVDLAKRRQRTATSFAYRVISARARLELALARSLGQSPALRPHLDRLKNATRWARWMAIDRGSPKDLQLYEQIQTQLAQFLHDDSRWQEASDNWSALIEEILSRDQSAGARSDWMQTLAFARMQRAEIQAKLGMKKRAYDDYQSAIKEFESAWALTDKDTFFRSNLAAAEVNLAQLLPDTEHSSHKQAVALVSRAIDTYRQLLQESATPGTLRRLADSHLLMVKLLDQSADDATTNDQSAAVLEKVIEHLNHAKLALTILSDQNELSEDGRAILLEISRRVERLSDG